MYYIILYFTIVSETSNDAVSFIDIVTNIYKNHRSHLEAYSSTAPFYYSSIGICNYLSFDN